MAEQRYDFNDFFNKESFEQGLREIEGLLASLQKELRTFDNAFQEGSKANALALKELNKQIRASATALNKLTASNTKASEQSEKLTASIIDRAAAVKKLQDVEKSGIENSKALRKQLAELQKELAKIKKSANEGSKPLDELSDKLKEVGENAGKIKGGESLDKLRERLKALKVEASGLDLSTDEGKAAFEELAAEGRGLDDQIKTLQRSFRNFSKTSEELGDTYKGQSKKLNELRAQYKNLAVQNKGNTKEAKALLVEITKLDTKLKDIDNSVGQNQRSVGKYGLALEGVKDGFGSALGGAGALSGGIAGLTAAFTEFAIAAIQDTIQDIKEFNKVLAESENFFRGSKEQAKEFAAVAIATGKVFGTEATENLQTLKVATDQFKASSEEATNALNTGLALAGSKAPQLAEAFNEFGTNISEAGFTFEEASIILGSAVSLGAKDVDKAGDLINNAVIELKRLKPEDLKGILPEKQFNEFTKVLVDVQNGTEPARKGIAKTIEIVQELGFQSRESSELISKVFTAVGEEGVSPEFLAFLGKAAAGSEKLTANLTRKQQALIELSQRTTETNQQLARLSDTFNAGGKSVAILAERIKTEVLSAFADFAEGTVELFDNLKAVFSVFDSSEASGILDFFKEVSRLVNFQVVFISELLFNVDNLTDGFTFLVSTLKGVKAGANAIFTAFKPVFDLFDSIDFKSISLGATEAFDEILQGAIDLGTYLQPVFDAILDISLAPFEAIFDSVRAIFPELDLPDSLKAVGKESVEAFTKEFAKTKEAIAKELAISKELKKKEKEAEEAGKKLGEKTGKGIGKGISAGVKSGTSGINKELEKLRSDAQLALAGGSESEAGLKLLFDKEKEALINQKAFKLLNAEEQNALLLQLETGYKSDLQALQDSKDNEAIAKNKAKNDAILNQLKTFYNIAIALVEKEASEEIAILKDKRAKGLITEEELQNGIKAIKESSAIELLEIEIGNFEAQLSEAELAKDERLRIEKELAEAKGEISATDLERQKVDAEKESAIQAKKLDKIKEGLEFTGDSLGAIFDLRTAFREKELADLETQKDFEIALAGDNAEAKEAIEVKFAAKEAAIKTKQAKQDKAKALFDIALNTASAIIAAIAATPLPLGAPFAFAAGALGAVQLAAVALKPIPKFAKGTEYVGLNGNPKGTDTIHAMVNEGERIVPTAINKQIGSDISNKALPGLIEKGLAFDNSVSALSVALNQKGLEQALSSRTVKQTVISDKGIFEVTRSKNNNITRIKKRFK